MIYDLLGTQLTHIFVVEDPLVSGEEPKGDDETLHLAVDGQEAQLLVRQAQE